MGVTVKLWATKGILYNDLQARGHEALRNEDFGAARMGTSIKDRGGNSIARSLSRTGAMREEVVERMVMAT